MNEEHSCIICLESVEILEKNMYCKCNFYFHRVCLQTWRLENNHCLLCRITYEPLPNYLRIYKACNFSTIHDISEDVCNLAIRLFFIYLLYSLASDVFIQIFFYHNIGCF